MKRKNCFGDKEYEGKKSVLVDGCLEGTRRFKETQIMLLIASPQHEMNMITSTVINLTIDLQMSCDMGEFSHFLSLLYMNFFIKSQRALKRRKLL